MAENIDFSRLTGAYAPAKFELINGFGGGSKGEKPYSNSLAVQQFNDSISNQRRKFIALGIVEQVEP